MPRTDRDDDAPLTESLARIRRRISAIEADKSVRARETRRHIETEERLLSRRWERVRREHRRGAELG